MPQLDFTTYPSQLFWLAITFTLLYFVLSKLVLPGIRDVLQTRQDRISLDLEKAETARQEAEDARKNYTEALEKARHNASTVLIELSSKLKKEASARHAALSAELETQAAAAEQRIGIIKNEAAEQLLPVTTQLVQVITTKLTGSQFNQDNVAAAINAANQQNRG